MNTLIGSAAIKHWFVDFNREPKDVDVLGNVAKVDHTTSPFTEYHYIPPLGKCVVKVLPPNSLFTLKVSHILWDIKWEKHMYDIVFLRRKGCFLTRELFDKLYNYWCTRHGEPKRSRLDVSYLEFFNNALRTQGSHDSLHRLIKDPPTFTKILVGEIETSEKLFKELSYDDKLSLIREETYVMAYERLAGRNYKSAYIAQLKEMILHHLPHEQALFAVLNFDKLRLPLVNYKEILDEFPTNSAKT